MAKKLAIKGSFRVPIKEVSGLAIQRLEGRPPKLVALGDESFEIATADLSPDGPGPFTVRDLRALFVGVAKSGGSQWEAVGCDQNGCVLLLQESPGAVFVLDPSMETLRAAIRFEAGGREAGQRWDADDNSRGEGLALLQSGHLWIVKEKNPPQLIEFGPKTDEPGPMAIGGAFQIEDGATLVALAEWRVEGGDGPDLEDLSDLAVGPDGAAYLLSDQGRALCRIEAASKGGGTLRIARRYRLPKAIKKPEGLVFLDDGSPLVAVDQSGDEENLFLLEAV